MSLILPFQTKFLSLSSWDLNDKTGPPEEPELLQPSLICKTSPNQLKNMPGCISVPGTIISLLN